MLYSMTMMMVVMMMNWSRDMLTTCDITTSISALLLSAKITKYLGSFLFSCYNKDIVGFNVCVCV